MGRRRKPARIVWRSERNTWTLRHGDIRVSLGTADHDEAARFLDLYEVAPGRFWSSIPSVGEALSGKALRQALYRALRGAQWRSSKRGTACPLTLDDIAAVIAEQGFCCAVSGMPFSDKPSTDGRRRPFAPSIDRLDNQRGYEIGNIQIVTSIVNLAKGDYGAEEFVAMCEAVSLRNRTLVRKPGEAS